MIGRQNTINPYKPRFPIHRILDGTSLFCLACIYMLVIYALVSLPHRIATHFDLNGRPNAFGSKNILLIMLIVATSLFVLLTLMSKRRRNNQETSKTASASRKSNQYIKTLFSLARFLLSMSFLLVIMMILLHSFFKHNSTLSHIISIALIAIPTITVSAVIIFFKSPFGNSPG